MVSAAFWRVRDAIKGRGEPNFATVPLHLLRGPERYIIPALSTNSESYPIQYAPSFHLGTHTSPDLCRSLPVARVTLVRFQESAGDVEGERGNNPEDPGRVERAGGAPKEGEG